MSDQERALLLILAQQMANSAGPDVRNKIEQLAAAIVSAANPPQVVTPAPDPVV